MPTSWASCGRFGGGLGRLGLPWNCIGGDLGGKLGPSGRLGFSLGRLGRGLGRLGTVLGRLGGDLDSKLGPTGRLGRVLGRLGTVLGRFGDDLGDKLGPTGRLGRILGPSGAVLGTMLVARWDQKAIQKAIKMMNLFEDRFLELRRSFGSQHVRILCHFGYSGF